MLPYNITTLHHTLVVSATALKQPLSSYSTLSSEWGLSNFELIARQTQKHDCKQLQTCIDMQLGSHFIDLVVVFHCMIAVLIPFQHLVYC